MAKQKGWSPLPLSLKVIFVILVIGVVSSLFGLISVAQAGFSFLGIYVTGIAGVAVFGLTVIAAGLLAIAFWNRYSWAGKYGIGYFGFFIANGLLGILNIPRMLALVGSSFQSVPGAELILYVSGVTSIIVGTVVNVVFLILVYRNKSYFE
jgi:hypothetical protein